MINLTLILPVYNEEKIIEPVFVEIKKALDELRISYECFLVDNGSRDNSFEVIKELAKKYKNTKAMVVSKGYGNAVLAGLKTAKGKYVCYMPSDGQIDLKVFLKLWKFAKSRKWNLVKVKRTTRENFIRLFVSYAFCLIIKLLFGIPFIDVNGSPRIVLKKNLEKLELQYKDSFIDTEFAVKAYILNWTIKELPMKTLPRFGGKSTRSWRTFMEFFSNLWDFKTSSDLSVWKKQNNQ